MEQTTINPTVSASISSIKSMYNDSTYFDQYSGSLVVFVIITICVLLLTSYFQMMVNVQPVIDDWPNQRCKPTVIPFAGLITHPEGVTAGEYTYQNFNYCMQNILSNISGTVLEPLTYITNSLSYSATSTQGSIQGVRGMFDKIRTSMQSVSEEIMGRIMNVMIPIIRMVIGFRDLTGKLQGTLTTSLYTFLGSYYTLRSLLGSIAQMIVTILIILAALIAGLWAVPITWGAAAANTVIFTAIAIPMGIILAFMKDTMHINSGLQIPTLKCFDRNTLLTMHDGSLKPIEQIKTGERLQGNHRITATFKVETDGSQMYILNGVLVSDSHLVQTKQGKWVRVSQHPDAIQMKEDYREPYLYCLNTTNHRIQIGDTIFSDWDEIIDENEDGERENGTPYMSGYLPSVAFETRDHGMVRADEIQVGTFLRNGEKVYGIAYLYHPDGVRYQVLTQY